MQQDTFVKIIEIATGHEQIVLVEAAAAIANLSADEIYWALEEEGQCETEFYIITDDNM